MLLRMKSSNLLTLHCSALILSWWLGSFVDLWIQDISAGGLYRVLSSGLLLVLVLRLHLEVINYLVFM